MSPPEPIRVLLVDDSPTALAMLGRMLEGVPDIRVVATAQNGSEALAAAQRHDPAVVITDLYMPVMDGLEFTKRLMSTAPRPILAVSVAVREPGSPQAFRLLEAGAVDLFPKPSAGTPEEFEARRQELIRKIRILSGVRVFRKHADMGVVTDASSEWSGLRGSLPQTARVVVIGASTGGPQALCGLFSQLPAEFPVPVVGVQHISTGFLQGLVDWLRGRCPLRFVMLKEPSRPLPGTVYFPPEDRHVLVDARGVLTPSDAAPVGGHRPSISLAMESAARAFGRDVVAALLTGMGEDGVDGLEAVHRAGGFTMAQDPASSVVYGMPARAVERGVVHRTLAPEDMGRLLARLKGA